MVELRAGHLHPRLARSRGTPRRGTLATTLAIAFALGGCARNLTLPASVAEGLDRAGLTLETAFLAAPQVGREAAIQAGRDALREGRYDGTVTAVDLVTVSGPANVRLGWSPAEHPLAYAVQWTAGHTVGLVLVSARTGEILLLTAY
jgi:hypothetical protein